ncbi:hypothetical protein IWW38_001068, partial [Coemansia aciculifera]
MAKLKTHAKGIRVPIPVPGAWAALVGDSNRFTGDDIISELHSHIHALATTSGPLTTFSEQSVHLKAATHLLSKLAATTTLTHESDCYLRSVAAPILVECYFLPSDTMVRRQTLPPIQGLMSVIDASCVMSLVEAQFLAFIGASSASVVDAYARQTSGQRAQAIELLASTSFGGKVLGRFTGNVLRLATAELEIAVRRMNSSDERKESTAEALQVRDDCAQTVRLILLCLSNDKRQSTQQSLLLEDTALLQQIYYRCWDVVGCKGSSIVELNSRQVAAMVLVHLVEGSSQSPAERAQALALHMLDLQQQRKSTSQQESLLPAVGSSESRIWCMDDAVAMACVARAIISVASAETALSTLDLVASSVKSPGGCNTVHEAVFTHIASICGRSQLAPAVKVLVFEAMAAWLEHTASMLKNLKKQQQEEASSDHGSTVVELGKRVLLLQRERIMGYLWSYWDDPLDAVQAKVKSIFEAFLDIGSAMSGIEEGKGSDFDPFIDSVLDLVLAMDWSRKVKYSLLATLCTRMSPMALFSRQPDLLDCCFETLAQVSMASRASTLLTALLERFVAAAGQRAQASEEDQFMALWVAPVVAALCKDDETSRRMMAQLVLPVLFT